jgi:hypothetical protein
LRVASCGLRVAGCALRVAGFCYALRCALCACLELPNFSPSVFSTFPPGRRPMPLWAGGRIPTSDVLSHLPNFSPSVFSAFVSPELVEGRIPTSHFRLPTSHFRDLTPFFTFSTTGTPFLPADLNMLQHICGQDF